MKKITTYITYLILAAVVMLTGCEETPSRYYNISVDPQVSCSFDRHIFEVKYQLMGDSMTGDEHLAIASTQADWVVDIDNSKKGVFAIEVEVNEGGIRSATIEVRAEGHMSTTFTLTQLAAPTGASHTLMYYFFGTSLNRFFNDNISDAKSAISTGILGENNRVLYLRQNSGTTGYIGELCYDPVNNTCIERHIKDITIEGSHLTPEQIGQHIAFMAAEAPADRYGMIMAGHGQGWLTRDIVNGENGASVFSVGGETWAPAYGAEITRAFGESNVCMNIPELARGIESSGVELDYILFDACFMSNIESIYDLRNTANYIIASPCEIMGRGFPYHRTLPHLFAAGGATSDLKSAAESYYLYYRDEYASNSRCGSVALYDCREIEALAEITAQIIPTATDKYDSSKLQTYEGKKTHIFYDFGQWVRTVATDETALAAFNEQLARTVIAKYTLPTFYSAYGTYGTYKIDVAEYTGVTTSAPSQAYPEAWSQTSWYKEVWE